ncbi:MAG: cbb3-type cytochrome oxidase assembly protein CcoS [Pseudomonadales bacterium]|nr:cbb3-type cytochrome oxidase assembly protein CcoS [Pseudomonadales bacterium]RLU04089.1 MAG: cbb3-type cytochrome oxidase assembly protein CcoS [Ketobacter sp.]
MDIIFLLIPLALVLLVVAVAAFFWAVRSDQFEDLDREASRILFDEDTQPSAKEKSKSPEQPQ